MGNVVIYERDGFMYALLREWLTDAGNCVRDSASPSDAGCNVDLAIVSISMPMQEGEALIRRVRARHPRARMIALSSQARSGLSSDGAIARELGVERVMAKPLQRSQLLAAVDAVIGPPGTRA